MENELRREQLLTMRDNFAAEDMHKVVAAVDMALAYLDAKKDAERLAIASAHYHVNKQDGTDTCKQCGLDLRERVHFAEYIAKRAAMKGAGDE